MPVRLVSRTTRLGTSFPSALPAAPRFSLAADAAATRGHRLELLRSPYEDLAVKAAAQFSRVTGIAARVNQSGRVYMVQVGRDLTLAEAWRLREEALGEGYDDARVRDAGGREVAAPALSSR
ncbi:MAG: hypothetical protein ABR599_11460 [Gemmatimonadota bacterium]